MDVQCSFTTAWKSTDGVASGSSSSSNGGSALSAGEGAGGAAVRFAAATSAAPRARAWARGGGCGSSAHALAPRATPEPPAARTAAGRTRGSNIAPEDARGRELYRMPSGGPSLARHRPAQKKQDARCCLQFVSFELRPRFLGIRQRLLDALQVGADLGRPACVVGCTLNARGDAPVRLRCACEFLLGLTEV
jgi:hypothetical protein